jgi:predicted enzyme related to lactoylglutathione lyase
MSSSKSNIGKILWHDLTVENATEVRNFYKQVVGWDSENISMKDYDDYTVTSPTDGETVGGVCHAKGSNSAIPPQWLMYVQVKSVHDSVKSCTELGGKVLDGPRIMSGQQFCVIQDPAGAVMALMSEE